MALEGSLKDFNITSILPIIKAENQTGVLEVKNKSDVIRVAFLEGQVVYAETTQARDMKRLRDTLLANLFISREDWAKLQETHAESMDHIWNLLPQAVEGDTVRRLLRRQVTDIIFELLRYQKGVYRFLPGKAEYPSQWIDPMDVDFLMMDGARIVDETTVMEKKLPSLDTFVRKGILDERSPGESGTLKAGGDVGDFTQTVEYEVLRDRGVELSDQELALLSVVGDFRSIRDLLDMANLSNLDAITAVVSLLQKKILVPLRPRQAKSAAIAGKSPVFGYALIAALVCAVVFAAFVKLPDVPKRFAAVGNFLSRVGEHKAACGLEKLAHLLQVYYHQTGKMALGLDDLLLSGLVAESDLLDPWGRRFILEKKNGGYLLYSMGADEFQQGDEVFFLPKR